MNVPTPEPKNLAALERLRNSIPLQLKKIDELLTRYRHDPEHRIPLIAQKNSLVELLQQVKRNIVAAQRKNSNNQYNKLVRFDYATNINPVALLFALEPMVRQFVVDFNGDISPDERVLVDELYLFCRKNKRR